MNSKFNIAPLGVSLFLIMAIFVGCSKGEIRPSGSPSDGLDPSSGDPISFYSENEPTKANEIQSDPAGFRVWSWFTSTAHPDGIDMFLDEGTQVKHDGTSWTYKPTRYWLRGNYDFAAVHPYSVTGTYATDENSTEPVLKISNYDVTNQDSLRVAFTPGIDGSRGTANNPVELNFQNTLSLVQLELRLEDDDFFMDVKNEETGEVTHEQIGFAYVTKVGFKDITTIGSLSASGPSDLNWSLGTTRGDMFIEYDSDNSVNPNGSNILGDNGMLAIPQTFDTNNPVKLVIDVSLSFPNIYNGLESKSIEIDMASVKTKTWDPNKRYKYILTLENNFLIKFEVTNVYNWTDDTLGGFIVN